MVVEKTATNFTMPVGYRKTARPAGRAGDLRSLLTGDTNIVTARLDLQYRARKASRTCCWRTRIRASSCAAPASACSRSTLVSEKVDAVLTTKRREMQEFVRTGVQQILDAHGVGIEVLAVSVQELAPPLQGDVRSAFQEVQNANADRERAVFEARAYKAQVVAEAQGEAQRRVSEASAEQHRRVEIASGEAERFQALALEHDRAPAITEQRIYLETLERILPRVQTYVIEPGKGGKVNLRVTR